MEKQHNPNASASNTSWEVVSAQKARTQRNKWAAMLALFLAAALFPIMPGVEGWMASEATLIIMYIMAAQGVSILTGYTGLVTVGHGGFLAVGAYASALMTKHFGTDLATGVVVGGFAAAAVGCALGIVFLRLSGAFMAIGTLGFAFFVGTVVNNVPIFEGREGISLPANQVLGIEIGDIGFYYVSLVTLGLTTLFIFILIRSAVGRAFMALRDSEKAAEASGVNRVFYRTLAFSMSAAVTGVAGVLFAHYVNYVSSEVFADIWYSVDFLVATVVGGSAVLLGPFVGGLFVAFLPTMIEFFVDQPGDLAFIIKGVALIFVLIVAPAGFVDGVVRFFRWALSLTKSGNTPGGDT
jgi:branched-chain amino acid transport system permease protein